MKAFNRLLFIAIVGALIFYFTAEEPTVPPPPPSPPPAPSTVPPPSPSAPAQPTYPTSMAERLLPPWPPAAADNGQMPLAEAPLGKNYVLIFDGSGSMAKHGCSGNRNKHEAAREAVLDWADTLPEDAGLGLVVFDRSGFSVRVPLGFGNRAQFRNEIHKVVPDRSTPLAAALDIAEDMLTTQGRRQLGYGEYTIVIVTDGVADDIAALERGVNRVLATSPIMIHTIGFCVGSEHSLNRAGRTVYRAADNAEELRRGLDDVLAEADSFDISGFK